VKRSVLAGRTLAGAAITTALAVPSAPALADTMIGMPPDLRLTISQSGTFQAGGSGTFQLAVSDKAGAGATAGPVRLTVAVSTGSTARSAAGDGWACSVSGQTVSCARPGSGADALDGGASYPPVTLLVSVPTSATATVSTSVSATVSTTVPLSMPVLAPTSGPASAPASIMAASDATVTLPVQAAPAQLLLTLASQGTSGTGQPGTYLVTVSDSAAAGPVTAPVTVTFPLPSGFAATSASGNGWSCSAGTTVTCTRSDPLAPGTAYPPVTVTTTALPG
jgi:hypothetical protein